MTETTADYDATTSCRLQSCQWCAKTILDAKPGQRFCSANCRAAHHRQHGKAASGKVQGISPCGNGDCVVVVRVPADNSARPRAWSPGQPIDLLERSS